MKEMELKTGLKEKEKETERNKMIETIELFKSQIRDIKDDITTTGQRIENLEAVCHEEKTELGETMFRLEETVQQLNNKVERVANALENVQEKMYDFEANKKNNLIFYGIPNAEHETENNLIVKVKEVIKLNMKVRRELVITTASRMFTGPEVMGCRPVLVTFEEFKDREEVLKKSQCIKKPTISVTEDLSKGTRESRPEL